MDNSLSAHSLNGRLCSAPYPALRSRPCTVCVAPPLLVRMWRRLIPRLPDEPCELCGDTERIYVVYTLEGRRVLPGTHNGHLLALNAIMELGGGGDEADSRAHLARITQPLYPLPPSTLPVGQRTAS
jgi:hypothetical protein